MKKYGVAIPLVAHGFKSAKDIINEHIAVQNIYNECIFSTDYTFDKFKLRDISSIIFYSNSENIFYEADIINTYQTEPSMSVWLSPEDYIAVEKKNWFHIKNIRPINLSDINNYVRENGKKVSYQIQTSKRPNKFYFEIEE